MVPAAGDPARVSSAGPITSWRATFAPATCGKVLPLHEGAGTLIGGTLGHYRMTAALADEPVDVVLTTGYPRRRCAQAFAGTSSR
jgi:hypothetical protein